MMANSGGYGANQNSSYNSEWNPNFSGYAAVTPSYGYSGMGTVGGFGGYGGYGYSGYQQAIGYTSPVVYGGGYRMW